MDQSGLGLLSLVSEDFFIFIKYKLTRHIIQAYSMRMKNVKENLTTVERHHEHYVFNGDSVQSVLCKVNFAVLKI